MILSFITNTLKGYVLTVLKKIIVKGTFPIHTVPKAFSMHETFPKLLGKISKATWKYWGGQNFQVV
jgi:hypothetical protein